MPSFEKVLPLKRYARAMLRQVRKHSKKRFVIVLGCYRSGSSCVSGVLSQIGVGFGDSAFPDKDNPTGFFEHRSSRRKLVKAFDESQAKALVSDQELEQTLVEWRESLLVLPNRIVGLKLPLLCLMGPQLTSVFRNQDVRYVVTERPTEQIVASMKRCNWAWIPNADLPAVVGKICQSREEFLGSKPCLRVQFRELIDSPAKVVDELTAFLEIPLDSGRKSAACEFVQRRLAHF